MRAPVSVIIPTLDCEACLPACLAALGEGLSAGLIRELVISDGGSTDATRAIAEAAGAQFVTGVAGRGGQLVRGAERAGGTWLMFLHADTVLAPGWADAVAAHLLHRPDRAGYCRLRFDTSGWGAAQTALWANLRSRAFGLPYGDQGLLISAAAYREAGGYPDIPLMEDVALARRLRGRLSPLDAEAVTSAERYRAEGWCRRGGRNLILLVRYLAGADPGELARRYRQKG